MKATTQTVPDTVHTLFGDEIPFEKFCKDNGYKVPKKKDTRPEVEKQDIYTVQDDEISELVCARSHGHARSIYLRIIGESWDFTGSKLSIKKQHALKPLVQEHRLSAQIDTFCELVIREMYECECYLWQMDDNEDEMKLSLNTVLDGDYDEECVYWSIPKLTMKTKKVCNKKNKKNASEISRQ